MPLAPPQSFRKTEGIHRIGLSTDKPAAADVLIGTLYFSVDTLTLQRSNGTIWENYVPPAGVGPQGPTGPQGPPGPLIAHHAVHESGGNDEIVNINATRLTSETVPDARLPANIARKDSNNNFTTAQTINGTLTTVGLIYGPDLTAGNTVRAGNGVYERYRTAAMGEWTDVPFDPANFAGIGGGIITVSRPVDINHYMIIGKTLFWQLGRIDANISGTPSPYIRLTIPGGYLPRFQGDGTQLTYLSDNDGFATAIVTTWLAGQPYMLAQKFNANLNGLALMHLALQFEIL